jgi:hypothetical protein
MTPEQQAEYRRTMEAALRAGKLVTCSEPPRLTAAARRAREEHERELNRERQRRFRARHRPGA